MSIYLLSFPGRVRIFDFYIGGSVNEAAALGFILVLLGASCLFAINRMTAADLPKERFGVINPF